MKTKAYSNMDYHDVISFLRRLYQINKNQHSWLPARWEYAEYFANPLYIWLGYKNWTSSMRLWINDDFEIVGIVNSENPDEKTFIQIHPDYRYIEEEMIDWAEKNTALKTDGDGNEKIIIYCHDNDKYREAILKDRGYKKSEDFEHLKWQTLEREINDCALPSGYSIHSFEETTKLKQKIICIAKAFHPSDNCTEEDIDDGDLALYGNLQRAPLYRKDLDIYTKYKDGSITSTALVWFDPICKAGMFEPVATHPDHHRMGIGKATVYEGLKRLKELGAKTAYVGANGMNKSRFYESAGFLEYDICREWIKHIK